MKIKGKGFVLREFQQGDQKSLIEHISDPVIARNTLFIPYPYTMKHANEWIKHCRAYYQAKEGEAYPLAITIDDKVVGSVGIHKLKRGHKAEIGYWLGREYWGQGIMTDAVKRVTAFAFTKWKLHRLYADVFPSNKASARVLENAGYTYEGTLRKDVIKKGKYLDHRVYAKVR
jgi:RimJ/RimL family protein N-acetyltransferase